MCIRLEKHQKRRKYSLWKMKGKAGLISLKDSANETVSLSSPLTSLSNDMSLKQLLGDKRRTTLIEAVVGKLCLDLKHHATEI
ncbi:unnamed protein product [Thlaspi arvense]|uniref:Uncharacterized protein n=1 Tax=Thlaspi arvense TaxID=13288 RepID=A0AAU9RYD3_THLAR|nr:unnamed protein product [Thlaspi arvense]